VSLKLPSWATTIFGLAAGVLAILNETTFGFNPTWRGYASVILIFLAGLGISPLVGSAFRAALHISTAVGLIISSALAALALAVHTFNLSSGLRGVLQGVLAFAAAIGFAPAVNLAQIPTKISGRGATLAIAVSGSLFVVLWVVV
jgi:hypothetical protein